LGESTFELPDGDDDLTDHAVPGGRASGPAAPRRRPSRTPPAPRPHRPVHARYTTKCPTGRWAASWVVVLPPTDHWTRSGPVVVSSDFWNRPLQNWRSEFLAVGSMVVLSIYLRQRGSPQSKPVGTSHTATGVEG